MRKIWKIRGNSEGIPDEILKAAGSNVIAKLLVNRGIDSVSKINDFLNPLNMQITHSSVFSQMQKAVERVKDAIANGEKIIIYGDFDADGITSTAVLYKTLKEIGADVEYYIPNRETESHGLNTKAIAGLISKKRAKLFITVDCGITNVQEVAVASTFKADVIITDHHEAPAELPNAYAIINPKAQNALAEDLSAQEIEGLSYLAGVGVVLKLCCALLEVFEKEDFINELLPLVAVGTVADVVPLLYENRCFVTMGLMLIKAMKHKGLTTLLKSAGLTDFDGVTSETIAFTIAPRLNAAGRLDTANIALKVLISDDEKELEEGVNILNSLNQERQALCDDTFKEALEMVQNEPDQGKHSIVLFNPNWHIGIIGIVASKLVEYFNKPVFLMTKDDVDSNVIRCSCRSVLQVNVYEILSLHSELFLGFGGHSMAAGFSFEEKTINFSDFKERLNATIAEYTANLDLSPFLEAEMELALEDVNFTLIEELRKLEPYGAKNEHPLFVLNNLNLNSYKMIGQNANHLKMNLGSDNRHSFECVKWSVSEFKVPVNSTLDIVFVPKINSFNGQETVQLDVKDIHSEFLDKEEEKNQRKFLILDHRKKTNILSQVVEYIENAKNKISVFAETKEIKDILAKYETIKGAIFAREEIPENANQVMFFDCPPSEEVLKEIVSTSNPDIVHLMHFKNKNLSPEALVKMLSGMLKYCHNNKNGTCNINDIAKALNITNSAVRLALNVFVSAGMIELEELDVEEYKLNFLESSQYSKIAEQEGFGMLIEEIKTISDFKDKVETANIDEIYSIISK